MGQLHAYTNIRHKVAINPSPMAKPWG